VERRRLNAIRLRFLEFETISSMAAGHKAIECSPGGIHSCLVGEIYGEHSIPAEKIRCLAYGAARCKTRTGVFERIGLRESADWRED
jgi:hypothetical protein